MKKGVLKCIQTTTSLGGSQSVPPRKIILRGPRNSEKGMFHIALHSLHSVCAGDLFVCEQMGAKPSGFT